VDEPRKALGEQLTTDAKGSHGARAKALDQDVYGARQVKELPPAGVSLEIERHRATATVPDPALGQVAQAVTTWGLDLDDVRAVLGEQQHA